MNLFTVLLYKYKSCQSSAILFLQHCWIFFNYNVWIKAAFSVITKKETERNVTDNELVRVQILCDQPVFKSRYTSKISLFYNIFNILGLEMIIVTVNVAINKPAYQQNPFDPNDNIGDASNAVDGQKSDLSRNGGQCVVSAGKKTATWWVNLTSIHSIQNITIYYTTDNEPWGYVYSF